jgi:hypothetical protein
MRGEIQALKDERDSLTKALEEKSEELKEQQSR